MSWKQYTTVCGGPGATTRIAWAGPDEFWTVTTPSPPRRGGGLGLCRIKGGQVVGSFSTPNESPDPFRTMSSAVCRTPDDCWFGGVGARDASGQRVGGFHVRWDGTTLTTIYGPQGRGISDIVAADGRLYETTFIGVGNEERDTKPSFARPESLPQTIHTITGTTFRNASYASRPRPGVPPEGTELLGADAAGDELWFTGGGAASGTTAPRDTSQPRPPVAVRRNGDFFTEVPFDDEAFGDTNRFVDVGVLPGQPAAWVAAQAYADRGSTTAKATVARLTAAGTAEVVRLPLSGAGRGSAAKIECPAPDECWMLTTAGWLFHLTDGKPRRRLVEPAFANRIDFRPNESAAQFVPDTPPADDSRLFAPPPTELPASAAPAMQVAAKTVKALLFRVTKPKVRRRGSRFELTIAFTMRRTGRVQLRALRKGRVVARSSSKPLKPGRRTVRVFFTRKRYPDALRFFTAEGKAKLSSGAGSSGVGGGDTELDTSRPEDTATTGPDTAATGTDVTTPGGDAPATTTGPGNEVGTGPGNETVGTRAAR